MSLLDVYDSLTGSGGGSSFSAARPPKPSLPAYSGGYISSAPAGGSAANSHERGGVERIDINSYVDQAAAGLGGYQKGSANELGLQAIEVVGKAPGFIAERPFALANTLLGEATGGQFDAEDAIGNIPILGQLIGGAGDVLKNFSNLPAAIANSSEADSLMRGTTEGWSDDTMLQTGLGKQMTWGQFKEEARRKGWTGQDIKDLISGKKGTTDFGDRAMSSDALTEVALRLGSDPTNIALLGGGILIKAGKGVGLLAKMTAGGAELAKPLGIAAAAAEVAKGVGASSTWLGLASYAGTVGRGAGTALGTYKKLSYATTAGEIGLKGVDTLLGDSSPLSGFLEPLFSLNQKALDNQPLSQNQAFALFTAFHFNAFKYLGVAKDHLPVVNSFIRGSGVRAEVIKALGEGWNGTPKAVIDRLGGKDVLENLIVHAAKRIEFAEMLRNPALKASLEGYDSLSEAALTNAKVNDIVTARVVDKMKRGTLKASAIVESLRDWHGNREDINPAGLAFPWHGQHAIDRWTEYGAAAAPISQIFNERAAAVVGLADSVVKADLIHVADALKFASVDGQVPINEVRSWLSRYPQLVKSYRKSFEKYLGTEFEGQAVPLKSLQGKMRKAINDAPDPREVTHESAAAEAAAAKPELLDRDLAGPDGELSRAYDEDGGGATVAASRMRPEIATRLGLDLRNSGDVVRSRQDPEIASFEDNVGTGLTNAGFPVDNVSQSIGSWEGALEPSVEIQVSRATLEEARLMSATLGRVGKQDSVSLSFSGSAMTSRGLKPNGFEYAFFLPTLKRHILDAAAKAAAAEFKGFSLNDTTGILRVLAKAGEVPDDIALKLERVQAAIESILPPDLIGDTGLRTSHHPAYVEFVGKTKESYYDASYAQVISAARAAADPRAEAHAGLRKQVARAHAGATAPDAGAGLGSEPAVGRVPGNDGGAAGDLTLAPAQRVGLGQATDAIVEPGFLYHVTPADRISSIADGGLKPFGPEEVAGTREWGTGGHGRRAWFHDTEIPAGDGAVLRVRKEAAGNVRRDSAKVNYTQKRVPARDLEVLGGDGQWHPLDKFFESPVPDELTPHVQAVKAVYDAAEPAAVPDPLTMGLRAREDAGASLGQGVPGDESALRAELARLTQDPQITPENLAAAQDVQRKLESAILAKGEAKNGDVLYAASRDIEASRQFGLHHSLRDRPADLRAELAVLDDKLRADYGMYQLKAPPKLALFFDQHQGQIAAEFLKERTKLGEVLAGKGPLSPFSSFLHALTSPVRNDRLARDANQALINAYMPHGASPKDIARFVDRLREEAELHTFAGLRLFGGITSLTQQGINKIAVEAFPAKVVAAVGRDNFAKLLDQSSNRFIRATDRKIRAGEANVLEAGLNRLYKGAQGTFPGDATRVATKTLYHLFRFLADIRWHGMNMLEADLIGGTKYGLGTTRVRGAQNAEIGPAAMIHEGATPKDIDPNANGWLYARHNANRVSRAFDAKRPESTLETLRSLADTDPTLVTLREKFGGTPDDIVKGIDDMLYRFDKQGVAKTITEEAVSQLGAEEARALAPFLDQVFRRNDELFQSIKQTFNGNPNRTNLERIGNSYWLYWPLSYQIKATKWLVSVMTHEFGGVKTNLAPAAVYAHYYEEHKKRLATNAGYAAMFEQVPTLWFASAMIFPITPGDLGVSLSRIPRYVGGALGLWGEYKAMDNPGAFASAVMSMGPTYTAQLLERAGRDFTNIVGDSEANLYPALPPPASGDRLTRPRKGDSFGLGG